MSSIGSEIDNSSLVPVSHLESHRIPRVAWRMLRRLIGQTCAISNLTPLLTGNRGEYLRVVGIIVMVE